MRISDWSSDVCSSDLGSSSIARLALVYLGYFLASALWSDGFSLAASADLLRVTLLVLLFLAMTVHLASSDARFTGRLFFWIAASAGASLVAVFAAVALGLLPLGPRFGGFGLTAHPVIGATLYGFALLLATFELLPRAPDLRLRLAWLAVIALCRSEEPTPELQSLMRISYAVFCLKKK